MSKLASMSASLLAWFAFGAAAAAEKTPERIVEGEVHVFVEADEQKLVQRLYWIQFEAYLPSNDHSYKYKFEEKLTHAGLEFDVRARFGRAPGAPPR